MPICKQTSCLPFYSPPFTFNIELPIAFLMMMMMVSLGFTTFHLDKRSQKKWASKNQFFCACWPCSCSCYLCVLIQVKWANVCITSHCILYKKPSKHGGMKEEESKIVNILWVKRVKWVTCIITSAACAWPDQKVETRTRKPKLIHSLTHAYTHASIHFLFLRQWSHPIPILL